MDQHTATVSWFGNPRRFHHFYQPQILASKRALVPTHPKRLVASGGARKKARRKRLVPSPVVSLVVARGPRNREMRCPRKPRPLASGSGEAACGHAPACAQ